MTRFQSLLDSPPDVLVAGSGGAGVAAALDAARAGARVAIVESAPDWGGASAISGGGCFLVGTRLQRERGIQDSVDMAYEDWLAWGGDRADPRWARYYLERSNPDVFEWAESLGVTWEELVQHEGNRAPRWTRPTGQGLGLWKVLAAAAREAGVTEWYAEAPVVGIAVQDGRLAGVDLRDGPNGPVVRVTPRALVMATGGYMSNREMIGRHRPDLAALGVYEGSAVSARGEGHAVLEAVGADFANLDQVWMYVYAVPDHRDPEGRRGLAVRGVPDWIWVNRAGQRFHDEDRNGGASGTEAVLVQGRAWAIFDATMAAGLTVADPYYRGETGVLGERIAAFLRDNPSIHCGATPAEVARKAGIDADGLEATLAAYREAVAAGGKDAFGRDLGRHRAPETAPWYAMELALLARKSLGGVVTDLRCRVLQPDGTPLEGVFAAGEVAGMAGGRINGARALEGTMLGPSLFSGRVAGAWAAEAAGFGAGFPASPAYA